MGQRAQLRPGRQDQAGQAGNNGEQSYFSLLSSLLQTILFSLSGRACGQGRPRPHLLAGRPPWGGEAPGGGRGQVGRTGAVGRAKHRV